MYVLGLYSDGDYFKVSLLSKRGKRVKIEYIKEFKKSISNLNALKKFIDSKTSLFGNKVEVVSALSSEEVFVKKFTLPVTGGWRVKKALQFHLDDEIYAEEDRYFVPLYKKKRKETDVTLFGYTKEAMEGHLQDVKMLGIDSEWVSTVSRAVERFVAFFAGIKEPFFLFHLGWESSSFYLIIDGEIQKETSFKVGLKNIVDAVQKDQTLVDPVDMGSMEEMFVAAIDDSRKSSSQEVFFELEREISRAWTFILEKDSPVKEVKRVLFTGYAEFSRGLKDYLPPIDLKEVSLTPHLQYSSSQISSYAIEIGLSLDRIMSDKETLQLGAGAFMPVSQRKKALKYLVRYACLSLLGTAIIFFTADAFFIKRKGELQNRYQELIAKIAEKDSGIAKKVSSRVKDLHKNKKVLLKEIKSITQKKKIGKGPLPFAVIAGWLKEALDSDLRIDGASYKLVQEPDLTDPLREFIVELSLEFSLEKDGYAKAEAFVQEAQIGMEGLIFDSLPMIKEKDGKASVVMRLKS